VWWAVHDLLVRTGRPLPRRFRDLVAVNRRAYRAYVPAATRCPITLLTCYDDPSDGWFGDPQRWSAMLAAGRIDQLHSPGVTHLTLLDEPHAGEIAEILSRHIADVDGPVPRAAP
jgi:thioesterase domain-containing protein